jgi:DNA-binding transcriptional LysR family regulator
MVLAVPAEHRFARCKRVDVDRLVGQPLVLREAGSGSRQSFEKAVEGVGRSIGDMRVVLELGSNEAIKQAVWRGVGIGVLSILAVQAEVRSGRLAAVEVKGVACHREMFVVVHRRRALPLPARLFLAFVEAHSGPSNWA